MNLDANSNIREFRRNAQRRSLDPTQKPRPVPLSSPFLLLLSFTSVPGATATGACHHRNDLVVFPADAVRSGPLPRLKAPTRRLPGVCGR